MLSSFALLTFPILCYLILYWSFLERSRNSLERKENYRFPDEYIRCCDNQNWSNNFKISSRADVIPTPLRCNPLLIGCLLCLWCFYIKQVCFFHLCIIFPILDFLYQLGTKKLLFSVKDWANSTMPLDISPVSFSSAR